MNPDLIPNISDLSSRLGQGEYSTRDQSYEPKFIEIRPMSFFKKAQRVGNLAKFEELINRRQGEAEARTEHFMDPAPELDLLLTNTEPERMSNYRTAPEQPTRSFGPPEQVPLENRYLTSIGDRVCPTSHRSRRTGTEAIYDELFAALSLYGLDDEEAKQVKPSAGLEREAKKDLKRSLEDPDEASPSKSSKKTSSGTFSFGLNVPK